jgi:hypothetical protein
MEPEMSLLAGYDVVIEFSNELVRDLVATNLRLSGVEAGPPLEFSVPFKTESGGESDDLLHIKVKTIEVDLQTSRPLLIQLFFAGLWAETSTGANHALDGCIEVPVYFPYVLTRNNEASISLDLSGIEPWGIVFSAATRERIEERLQGSGRTYARFESIGRETLAEFIQKQPLLLIRTGLNFTSKEGDISPLRFYELETHGVGADARSRQALGLFGTLLVVDSYEGTSTFKTESAIPAGRRLAVSISEKIFQRFVFCDSIADALNCAVSDLPTACGSGGQRSQFNNDCLALRSIDARLNDNSIVLSGVFRTDLGDIIFHSAISLQIYNGDVVSTVRELALSSSCPSPDQSGVIAEANLEQFKPLIRALITSVSRKIGERLTECATSGLLGEAPEEVFVTRDQGLTFAAGKMPRFSKNGIPAKETAVRG